MARTTTHGSSEPAAPTSGVLLSSSARLSPFTDAELAELVDLATQFLRDKRRPKFGPFSSTSRGQQDVMFFMERYAAEGDLSPRERRKLLSVLLSYQEMAKDVAPDTRQAVITILENTRSFLTKLADDIRPPNGYGRAPHNPARRNGFIGSHIKAITPQEIPSTEQQRPECMGLYISEGTLLAPLSAIDEALAFSENRMKLSSELRPKVWTQEHQLACQEIVLALVQAAILLNLPAALRQNEAVGKGWKSVSVPFMIARFTRNITDAAGPKDPS